MVEKWAAMVSDKDIKVMMEEADLNDNKSLDFYEFSSVMRRAAEYKTTYAWRLFHLVSAENDFFTGSDSGEPDGAGGGAAEIENTFSSGDTVVGS